MKPEKANEIIKDIFEKETTTEEERKALLYACDCIWKANSGKVIDEGSFMKMLYNNMIYDYDVEINKTDNETHFLIKTFKNK